MIYTIQILTNTWDEAENLSQEWRPFERFEDLALAEKELANLKRQWPASGNFRLHTES